MDNEQNGTATPLPEADATAILGGTGSLPPAEPPAEAQGEPTELPDGTADEAGTPYEQWLAQADSDPDLKEEVEFQREQLRKEAKRESWKDYESRIGSQQDSTRQVVQAGLNVVTALERHLREDYGELTPENTRQVIAAIEALKYPARWEQISYPFTVVGALLGDEPFRHEMEAGLQAVANQRVTPEEWGKRYLSRVAESLPEDILREAVKSSPALRKLRAEWRAQGKGEASKLREAAEETESRVARRAGEGPDVPPRGSGSGGRTITREQLSKMTPREVMQVPLEEREKALSR